MRTHAAAAAGVIIGLCPVLVQAQEPGGAAPAGTATAEPAPPNAPAAAAREAPPGLRLGLRAALARTRLPVTPVVVLVPDARSYWAALGAWNYEAGSRFPVLIDDGSWPARMGAARFVRAFKPKAVVRWSAPENFALPEDAAARRALIEQSAARPWGLAEDKPVAEALRQRWEKLDFKPPAVVVMDERDPAWVAGVALAAGRGGVIAWAHGAAKPDGYMSPEDAAALEKSVEQSAAKTGYSWDTLGDDLDAVTLCLNCATKVFMGEKDHRAMLSLTDWIGRAPGEHGEPGKARWAWAGQIIGSEWQAAYMAMSSLFLVTDRAWLFDGYDSAPPWNQFDATEAGATLEKLNIRTVVDDEAGRSITAWRRRSAGRGGGDVPGGGVKGPMGIDAGLICVNTSGNADFFTLKPGEGKPDDVPILRRPAMVHFVHSWSAQAPSDVQTVAGRWLERGAYLYAGSVHEPYLQAFVPTPKLALRMTVGMPFGAAARLDDGEPWKVSILGDPLATLGRSGPVVDRPLPLAGARDVAEDLRGALKERDFARALADLLVLGRDEDGAQLIASAAASKEKDKLNADAGLYGLACAFFAGDLDGVATAYRLAQPRVASEELVRAGGLWDARDMLWHALWPDLGGLGRERAQLLSMNLRAETLVRDAGEASSAVAAAVGPEAAADVRARAMRMARDEAERKRIEAIGR